MLYRLLAVLTSLNNHNARYLVIGEIAALLHGVPRASFDLDILYCSPRMTKVQYPQHHK
jgi:hypothetical protein